MRGCTAGDQLRLSITPIQDTIKQTHNPNTAKMLIHHKAQTSNHSNTKSTLITFCFSQKDGKQRTHPHPSLLHSNQSIHIETHGA